MFQCFSFWFAHVEQRLGAGHPDLGAGVDVNPAVWLAADGGADSVGDAQHERPARPAVAQRLQRVRRLPGLGDQDSRVVSVDGAAAGKWIALANKPSW